MSLRARVLTIAVLAGVVAVSSALAGCGVTLATASGAVALLLFAWDVYATAARRNWRGAAWCAMTLVLPLLIWLHGRMDAALDADTGSIQDHRVFFHVREDAIEILRVRDRKEAYR